MQTPKQNERMQKHPVWNMETKQNGETNTHLKLFQGGICSITQLFPQSGKVHRILNPVIVIWKLNRKPKLPSSETENSITANASWQQLLTYLPLQDQPVQHKHHKYPSCKNRITTLISAFTTHFTDVQSPYSTWNILLKFIQNQLQRFPVRQQCPCAT